MCGLLDVQFGQSLFAYLQILAADERPYGIDVLIERLIFATNRADLTAATKALDRVLLWNFYVVPQWTYGKVRSVRWDRFGRPDPLPKYGFSGFPTVWWWDQARASKVGSRS